MIVVAPVFGEEATIDRFLDRVAEQKGAIGLVGLVLVDDGSADGTVTRIRDRAADYPVPIRLVRLSRNFGHQNAVLAGFETAWRWSQERGAEWIGVLDADLQDDPADFTALLAAAEDADVVYAVRERRLDGPLMRLLAPLFYRILSRSSAFPIPENAGTFSIVRSAAARALVECRDNDPYFPGLRAWVGFRQKGVAVVRRARAEGRSRVGVLGLAWLSLRALLLYSSLPLTLTLYTGVALASLGALASIVLAVLRLVGLITIPGATTIVILQLMSFGVQMIFLGVLANMINRVRLNTNHQRSWVVMEDRVLS